MPVKITFTPNRSGQAAFGRSEGVYRELERRAQKVIDLAQRNAPDKTGEYKRSFRIERVRVRGAAAVRVTNSSPASAFIEFGTRAHVIEPRDKKALSWPGGRHPVARVHHPGTPALHVLRNALRAAGR